MLIDALNPEASPLVASFLGVSDRLERKSARPVACLPRCARSRRQVLLRSVRDDGPYPAFSACSPPAPVPPRQMSAIFSRAVERLSLRDSVCLSSSFALAVSPRSISLRTSSP